MRFLRFLFRPWIVVPLCAAGFLLWIDGAREARVERISKLAGGDAMVVEATSPTGYAGGLRQLIVPEHNNDSYQWIAQTQQMAARGEWRIRHADYDNAPFGREIRSASVYRWWLGFVGWIEHVLFGHATGIAIERAAIVGDAWLHLLLLGGGACFVAWRFGGLAAGIVSLALVFFFPLAGSFLPGQPEDHGLSLGLALWSMLLLIAGIRPRQNERSENARDSSHRWFFGAGMVGACGLWVNSARQGPLILGVALGALLATGLARRRSEAMPPLPWRAWALGGAAMTLLGFVAEFYPRDMAGLQLDAIHPLLGLAWLGLGELLARAAAKLRSGAFAAGWRGWLTILLSITSLAALPIIAVRTHQTIGPIDSLGSRFTNLPNGPSAENLFAWLSRDGVTTTFLAAVFSTLLLAPAIWALLRRGTFPTHRTALAIACGPAICALGFACVQLRWWSAFEMALIPLLVVVTVALASTTSKTARRLWVAGVGLIAVFGGMLLIAPIFALRPNDVTPVELESLIERDLAHWLANRVGPAGAVVLAPPNVTTSFFFHGGLRGLSTPYRENAGGFSAAVRIAGATSADEAQALARRRNVTHIVIPSWDAFMDEYARLGAGKVENTFTEMLHRWLPPRWLRAVPYQIPAIPGFEAQRAVVYEVVDVQDNAVALSRLGEYFVEMGQLDLAASVAQALQTSFVGDFGAITTRARIHAALRNPAGFNAALTALLPALARGDDESLPWDRRVSLTIALADAKRLDLARVQIARCLADMDESLLRSLTNVSLFQFLRLGKATQLEIRDPKLRALAPRLLPLEMREQL
jgi:hypothetical protein